jgi:poly(A) polymerase
MCAMVEELARSARPRVLEEILRLLRSGTALGAFRMLRASGALKIILPQIDTYLGPRDDPDPAAHDRADAYWRLLEALDAHVHAGHVPSTAVCVSVLFLRIIEREAAPNARSQNDLGELDLGPAALEVLEPFAMQTRLSRRDTGKVLRIIRDQRRFLQSASKRFSPLLFMHGEDFPEALDLFRLRSVAWGQGWDVYESWVARYEKARETSPEELESARRKTRRRRRRRGAAGARGEGVSEGSAGPDLDSSTSPTERDDLG